jgi:hypothetical protein
MGILRTNEISGLETPTPVTGSVYFDGDGDYLSIADSNDWYFGSGDFTVELFFNAESLPDPVSVLIAQTQSNDLDVNTPLQIRTETTGLSAFVKESASIVGQCQTSTGLLSTNSWNHIAYTRDGSNMRLFVNGILRASASFSGTVDDGLGSLQIGGRAQANYFNGYISNVRILKGTALYTSDFTPPVHELQPIGDTVLLCCNNPDSAAAASYAGIGTSKTITVNGNAAASTFSPGLTRDFTFGTQFQGVAKFDTQGYFVPPSGTTEQRFPNFAGAPASSARGVFASGGEGPTGTTGVNTIEFITIATTGNAQDFGDLTSVARRAAGCSSSTRGVIGGGYRAPAYSNTIDYVTISSTGNGQDFGDLLENMWARASCSNSIRGIFAGGYSNVSPFNINRIEYITIESSGNSQDFGDLFQRRREVSGCSSSTRGIFCGGRYDNPGNVDTNIIDYITISTTANALDFGDLNSAARTATSASSNSTRGVIFGGSTPGAVNVIDYVTIASLGNAADFGDLLSAKFLTSSCSSSTRATSAGGTGPNNVIEYVTIASTGNAQDFGDLSAPRGEGAALSNGHGGLG